MKRTDFISALAYLIRRLDENHVAGKLPARPVRPHAGLTRMLRQEQRFIDGWTHRADAPTTSHRRSRRKDRKTGSDPIYFLPVEKREEKTGSDPIYFPHFENAVDTDWTQAGDRVALLQSLAAWKPPALPTLQKLEDVLTTAKSAQPAWEAGGFGRAGRDPAAGGGRHGIGPVRHYRADGERGEEGRVRSGCGSVGSRPTSRATWRATAARSRRLQ